MSAIGHLRMIPSAAWPLGVGLLVNSLVLGGNVGLSLAGPTPIVRNQLGDSELEAKDRVRVWSLSYKTVAAYTLRAIASTTTLHLLAAYLTPSRRVRNFSLTAAIVSLTIIPHTALFLSSTERLILNLDTRAELTPAEEKDVGYYLAHWNKLNRARYVQYALSWTFGLGALLGVAGRW